MHIYFREFLLGHKSVKENLFSLESMSVSKQRHGRFPTHPESEIFSSPEQKDNDVLTENEL